MCYFGRRARRTPPSAPSASPRRAPHQVASFIRTTMPLAVSVARTVTEAGRVRCEGSRYRRVRLLAYGGPPLGRWPSRRIARSTVEGDVVCPSASIRA